MISVSSRSHPAPMPNRNLPLERWSRVAISLASSSGWCSGTKQIPVPNLRVVVTAEALARPMKGSPMSLMDGGILPSGLPWYRVVTCTGITPCSGSHRDSNPRASAFWATTATSSDRLETLVFMPIFMVASLYSRVTSMRIDNRLRRATRKNRPASSVTTELQMASLLVTRSRSPQAHQASEADGDRPDPSNP